MKTRFMINGRIRYYDLNRITSLQSLKKGDGVMLRRRNTQRLVIGKIFAIVNEYVTIVIPVKGEEPDYMLFTPKKLYRDVYSAEECKEGS